MGMSAILGIWPGPFEQKKFEMLNLSNLGLRSMNDFDL